jgi:SET domain-containing protein
VPTKLKPWEVRDSGIHGRGVFATRRIDRGDRLMQYRGERIDWDEANARYERAAVERGHTFFFDIGNDLVLDGGSGGNSSRWINHGCTPNVEATIKGKRVYLYALRRILPGEELLLDYRLEMADDSDRDSYACRCSSADCRETMLAS